MHFKEIIIQGLFGVAKGVRLPLTAGLCEPLLPPPLDATKFKNIVALLLYPVDAQSSGGIQVDTQVPHPVRLGGVLEIGGLEYKLVWDLKEDTLQVVSASGGVVASGREEAQALWQKLLGPLPFRFFGALHHHEFFAAPLADTQDKTAELVEEYRRALSIERVEGQIGSIEAHLHEIEHSRDPATRLENALDKVIKRHQHFQKLPELEARDQEFLDSFEARSKAMQVELDDVVASLQYNEQQLARTRPTALLRDRIFWLGFALGLGCMIAAYVLSAQDPRYRAVALGNVLGFGLALTTTLRRLGQHDRHMRIEAANIQLKARRIELEKTLERESLRVKRLQQRFGASSAEEILDAATERTKLTEKRRELEQRLKAHLNDPEFIARRTLVKGLRDKLEALRKHRESFASVSMPSYELGAELERRGVPVANLLPLDDSPGGLLVDCARELGLVPDDAATVEAQDLPVFNTYLSAIVSRPEARLSLHEGHVLVSTEARSTPLRELDERRQTPWLRAMALGLLSAHQRTRAASGDSVSLLVLADPWRGQQRNERVRFYSLLKELARSTQVVLPRVGE